MLVVQVSSDEAGKRSTRVIKKDFKALGHLFKGQVVFSLIPSIAGRSLKGNRKTHMINKWLEGWCQELNFGCFDHGAVYMAPGLLETRWGSLT